MRITAGFACLLVGLDCATKALGTEHQVLFASNHLWVWWIGAIVWVLAGVTVFYKGAA